MSSPSNSAALVLFNAHPSTALVKKSEERDPDKRWALFNRFTFSPGRNLNQVYTVWGHALEKQANRVAHKIGIGSHATAQKLHAYFGDGERRLLKLQGLRSCTPRKVRDYCANLVKYTFPIEAPTTQLRAFRNVVHLCTRFPGLRAIFLGCKAMQGATSAAGISELWYRPPELAPPSEEWSFWQALAAACLSETMISTLLDDTPVTELTRCPEEGLSVIEQLLVVWDSSADSKFSAALCVRYLGGILDLPGFWVETGAMHSLVVKKLCRGMVRALKDIGVDVLQLGFLDDDDDPPFDYDGLDFLAATMLVALASWFGKFDEQEKTEQLWYDSLRELLRLLRAPRSVDLLPQASAHAIEIWEALLPLRLQSAELDITARCEDGDGPSVVDSSIPLASVTGALVEDNLNGDDKRIQFNNAESAPNLVTPGENPDSADALKIELNADADDDLTPDHAEQSETQEDFVDAGEDLVVEINSTLARPKQEGTWGASVSSADAQEDMEDDDGNIVFDSGPPLASVTGAVVENDLNNNYDVQSDNEESAAGPSTPQDPGGGGGPGGMGHVRSWSNASSTRPRPYPSPNTSPQPGYSELSEDGAPAPGIAIQASNKASHNGAKQETRLVCPMPGCESTFTRSFDLKEHIHSHNGNFTRSFNFKGHIWSHNEVKPFSCKWPGCGKGFALQRECKRHEQLHANYRPFNCDGCGKMFERMDALNRHLRLEGGAECQRTIEANGRMQSISDLSSFLAT